MPESKRRKVSPKKTLFELKNYLNNESKIKIHILKK